MQIVTLTEKRFKSFSDSFNKKHYKQTIQYANLLKKDNNVIYLGLEDNNYNVVAATIIIEKRIKLKYKYGYAPCGFLIDYENKTLFETFSIELKKYLTQLNYVFLNLDPIIPYRILDKNFKEIKCNYSILDHMKNLDYINLNTNNNLNAVINSDNNINILYNKLNRSLKRQIKNSNLIGINYYQDNDIQKFYSLIQKKHSKKDIEYYKNLSVFLNEDCEFELYFSKINSETYLNNYRYILRKEEERNNKFKELISNPNISKTKKLLNDKMKSDKLITKYKNRVIEASNIFSKYPEGLIIGACAIIKCDKTIYFIEEGYEEKLRNIYSLNMLKWEIIKKYASLGYHKFDLGTIPQDDKVHGVYLSKTSFNPEIHEYIGNFDLVINKYIYTIFKKIKKI